MRSFSADQFDAGAVVEELLDGGGAVRLEQVFTKAQVEEARNIILEETSDHKD